MRREHGFRIFDDDALCLKFVVLYDWDFKEILSSIEFLRELMLGIVVNRESE